jgi:CO/xanthine dehydrogenase Mo-binding subunit
MPSYVGTSVPRVEAAAKVSGEFRYLRDLDIPGALWASVVRSPYPHARVAGLGRAVPHPGVVAFCGFDDVPAATFNPATVPASPYMTASADKRLLTGEPAHVGDGVAVVVAKSLELARAAARDWPVTWEELPAITTLEDGRAAGAMGRVAVGDEDEVANLFSRADLAVRETFRIAAAQHVCLDSHACAAVPRGRTVTLLYTSAQAPGEIGRLVREVLGLADDGLIVEKVQDGGGFGNKQELYEEALAVWLSRRLNRPVRVEYSREEEFAATRTRHAMRIDQSLAFRRDGTLTACRIECVADSGAYASHTPYVLSAVSGHARLSYPHVPVRFQGWAVRTNNTPAGAYRGYGAGHGAFAFEQCMDIAAGALGLSPTELRLRNAPDQATRDCLRTATRRFGGAGSPQRPGEKRGVGCAVAAKHSATAAELDQSTAAVTWQPDGSAVVSTGTCDCGTGSSTALGQIAADALGIPLTAVRVAEGLSGYDLGSTAQRSVFVGGIAVRDAAAAARRNLLSRAAQRSRGAAAALDIAWPHIVDASSGEPVMTVREACEDLPGRTSSATSRCPDPGLSVCACLAEVAVDTETGVVRVLRTLTVADCGLVVNPAAASGQVAGAVAQGIGLALSDALLGSLPAEAGERPAVTIGEHGVPGALDVGEIDVEWLDSGAGRDGWAARGIGELGILAVSPAIANAVSAAVGARQLRMPMRPGTVWASMHWQAVS